MGTQTQDVAVSGRGRGAAAFAVPALRAGKVKAVAVCAAVPPEADVVVLACGTWAGEVPALRPQVARVAQELGVDVAAYAAALDFKGAVGRTCVVPLVPAQGQATAVVLVGVGAGSAADFRTAGGATTKAVAGRGHAAVVAVDGCGDDAVAAFVTGIMLGGYAVPTAATAEAKDTMVEVSLVADVEPDIVQRAVVGAHGTMAARDLCAMPSSVKTPEWMAQQAVAAVAGLEHVTVDDFDTDRLAAEGFGALMAVGGAGEVGPRLVRVDYSPPGATRHVGLVGKGITFDTGGVSLKPSEAMTLMRTDMTGSAVVLHALAVAARWEVPVRVTALLALAENCFDGASYRPADVMQCWGGKTVEISNTDAEGRLVLADALAYCADQVRPDVMVDVATLTGAATMALGRTHAAGYCRDGDAMADLIAAGERAGELVWHMPLVDSYREVLDSPVADIRHASDENRRLGGGSIQAALFLEEFTDGVPWVHLDIAGPARAEGDTPLCPKGGTGYGVRLLAEWLSDLAHTA